MPLAAIDIREAALALTQEQRLLLADELYMSLDSPPPGMEWSAEFIAELNRRSADMDSGADPGIPWEVVRAEMEEEMKETA